MKKIIDIFWGLIISGPVAVLILVGMLEGIDELAIFGWIAIIFSLPFGIVGIFLMMWGGLTHGLPEYQAIIGFSLGAIWVFIFFTKNCSYLVKKVAYKIKESNKSSMDSSVK